MIDALAAVLAGAGLVAGAVVAVAASAPRLALGVLLDFLLAAGLLRLARADSWTAYAVAAMTIGVRQVASRGLQRGRGHEAHPDVR